MPDIKWKMENEREDLMEDRELYLVTGGAGFIGSHIAESARQTRRRVRVLDTSNLPGDARIYHRSPTG